MTAANVKIYQREVAEFAKYVKILESFFHNAASAEQMNEKLVDILLPIYLIKSLVREI